MTTKDSKWTKFSYRPLETVSKRVYARVVDAPILEHYWGCESMPMASMQWATIRHIARHCR